MKNKEKMTELFIGSTDLETIKRLQLLARVNKIIKYE